METSLLQAFVDVAEKGSFSAAAESLELTQPAVSKRISVLEEQLGTRLFDRIGKQIGLTEAGELLLPRARRIIQEVRDSHTLVRNLTGMVSGRLALGISHHIGLHRLPPVLRKFSGRYPDVALDIGFMESESAVEAVSRGDLELAVITLAEGDLPRIVSHGIWTDPLSFVVANDHPLADREGEIPLKELQDYPAILPGEETFTRRIVDDLFRRKHCVLQTGMETNYLETVKMMISIGLGWSVLPDTMVDRKLQRLNVKQITVSRRLGYVYHRERTLSNAAAAFIRLLEQHADD